MPVSHAPSRFISFEGGEGSGKSTQIKRLAARLEKTGHGVVLTREPGGTPLAEKIRNLLVREDTRSEDISPLTEVLLLNAARHQHVQQVIAPALARGDFVVTDRFSDSTLAYQGYGHGLPLAELRTLEKMAIGAVRPALTVWLRLDAAAGLARSRGDTVGEARFERMGETFHGRVVEGFSRLAEAEPQRFLMLDARQSIEAIEAEIWRHVAERFGITEDAHGAS